MKYEHHIFVSYARGEEWTDWVRDVFVRRLKGYLELEIGRTEVFLDDQIQTGARWAEVLKRKWCRRELALMFEREKELDLTGHAENYGLVIPVRIGDGKSFPELIGAVQHHDFESYVDPDLPAGSQRASDFNADLRKLAKTIALTLDQAPRDCCENWHNFTGGEFFRRLAPKRLPPSRPPRPFI
jgi:hypothetical protein